MSFYRLQDADRDPAELLDPAHQWSTPWGTGDPQQGVSVCTSEGWLIAYFQARYRDGIGYDPDFFEGVHLIELDGDESDELDADHAEGARLVFPTRIISAGPMSPDMIAEICS